MSRTLLRCSLYKMRVLCRFGRQIDALTLSPMSNLSIISYSGRCGTYLAWKCPQKYFILFGLLRCVKTWLFWVPLSLPYSISFPYFTSLYVPFLYFSLIPFLSFCFAASFFPCPPLLWTQSCFALQHAILFAVFRCAEFGLLSWLSWRLAFAFNAAFLGHLDASQFASWVRGEIEHDVHGKNVDGFWANLVHWSWIPTFQIRTFRMSLVTEKWDMEKALAMSWPKPVTLVRLTGPLFWTMISPSRVRMYDFTAYELGFGVRNVYQIVYVH